MKRVLVTGIAGFVGRNVVEPLLQRGFEIHGLSRTEAAIDDRVTLHRADLLSPGVAKTIIDRVRPSHLLHLAWAPSNTRMRSEAENQTWARASLDMFESFAAAGGRRAVFGGTCAEYDWRHERLVEGETPLLPRTPYGTAKNALRDAVEALAPARGVVVGWARLFFLYGPYEPRGRLVTDICCGLLAKQEVELSTGLQERDYMYIGDAGAALANLSDSDLSGPINVASGTAVTVRSLATRLAALTGGGSLLKFGRRPTAADDPPRLVGDVGRLSRELGFTPRYSLDSGLAQTLRWWRASGRC